VIDLAKGAEEALALLDAARRQTGGVRSAHGEVYELPDELDAVIASDPWRAELTPWALAAIAQPDEAWLFRGGEPTDEPIEHRPHILVARAHADAPPRAVERQEIPVPIWIGMEIHEFRTAWTALAAHRPFRGLLASPVRIDGGAVAPLVDQLTQLAAQVH
jgi:hypothetical protein